MVKVVLFLPSLAGGGAERVFVELANDFADLGLSVDLVLAHAVGPYLSELGRSVRVVDLDSPSTLRSLPKLAHHLKTERPTAILSALDHANVVSIGARAVAQSPIRCVISSRSVPSMLKYEAGLLRAWGVVQAARLTYRFADAVIANSDGVAAVVSQRMSIPRSRIHVIHNPVSIESIERLSREPLGFAGIESAPLILGVGRLSGLKDFPTLLRAFAIARAKRACRLVILGDGPDRERLEALACELGVRDELLMPGFVSNPFAWMRRASMLVSSSISEGCPNAVMQALACGTPVVSTDCVGGSREILEHGRWGRLVAVGDPNAMADAIVATLDATQHPDVRQRAGDFAHVKVALQYLRVLLPDEFGALAPA